MQLNSHVQVTDLNFISTYGVSIGKIIALYWATIENNKVRIALVQFKHLHEDRVELFTHGFSLDKLKTVKIK